MRHLIRSTSDKDKSQDIYGEVSGDIESLVKGCDAVYIPDNNSPGIPCRVIDVMGEKMVECVKFIAIIKNVPVKGNIDGSDIPVIKLGNTPLYLPRDLSLATKGSPLYKYIQGNT